MSANFVGLMSFDTRRNTQMGGGRANAKSGLRCRTRAMPLRTATLDKL